MTRLTAEEPMFTWMGLNILVNGEKTSNMDSVWKPGLTVPNMKETMSMGKSMEPVLSNGLMAQCILVNSTTTTFTARESTHGLMAVSTRASGEIIKCMEKVLSPGLTAGSMSVNTWMTRSKATENSFGLMVAATRETGKEGNNTAKVFMSQARALRSSVSGRTARESDGSVKMLEPQIND